MKTSLRMIAIAALTLRMVSSYSPASVALAQEAPKQENKVVVLNLNLDSRGSLLAVFRSDSKLELWDVARKQVIRDFGGGPMSIQALAFSDDGRLLASAGVVEGIVIWDVARGTQVGLIQNTQVVITTLAFSPDGRVLAEGQSDGGLNLWEIGSGRKMRTLSGHTASVASIAFSPNGRWLASGSWDKSVGLWEVATGKRVASLTGHTNWVNSVVFSSDNRRLASGGSDGLLNIWQVPDGHNLSSSPNLSYGMAMPVSGLAFSSDGEKLASVSIGQGGIWNGKTGGEIRSLQHLPAGAEIVRFSADGTQLIVTGKDGRVEVLDPVTGDQKTQFSVQPAS